MTTSTRTKVGLLQEQKAMLISVLDSLTLAKQNIDQTMDNLLTELEDTKIALGLEMVEAEAKYRMETIHMSLEDGE